MFGKIIIKCKLKAETGMHIGSSSAFSAIGAVDSPVIRDALSGEPMLPGSSLKGKMRTLLARKQANEKMPNYITQKIEHDSEELKRLFGSSSPAKAARLCFSDAFLLNGEELRNGKGMTEIKFENTISRIDATANPRQIERVVKGAVFGVVLAYTIETESETETDIKNIAEGLKLLSLDYLGGHGSRGYGRISFSDFEVSIKEGECPIPETKITEILKEVEKYAVFAV